MRKRLLGSIAALAAGAGAALGQAPVAPPGFAPPGYAGVQQAGGFVGGLLDPQLGGPMPADGGGQPPSYPPPGYYGAAPYSPQSSGAAAFSPQVWINTEYLLWFVRSQPTNVPYVTTSAPGQGGLRGNPSTALLYSDRDLGYDLFSGFRITGGGWCGPDRRVGLEASGFLTEQKANSYFAGSDGNGLPTLARPFLTETGASAALIVSDVTLARGNLLVITRSQTYGAELSGLVNLYRGCPGDKCPIEISGLLGFRFLELEESLQFTSASTLLGGGAPLFALQPAPAPGTVAVRDDFRSLNRFYGGQVGLKANATCGNWFFAGSLKVGLGVNNQLIDIRGRSEFVDPTRNINTTILGGLYANPQNIGRVRNDEFTVLPEGTVSVGYNVTPALSLTVGYSGLYMNRVSRPGNLIPQQINTGLLPTFQNFGGTTVALPNPTLTQDEFWAQGVSFSVLMRY